MYRILEVIYEISSNTIARSRHCIPIARLQYWDVVSWVEGYQRVEQTSQTPRNYRLRHVRLHQHADCGTSKSRPTPLRGAATFSPLLGYITEMLSVEWKTNGKVEQMSQPPRNYRLRLAQIFFNKRLHQHVDWGPRKKKQSGQISKKMGLTVAQRWEERRLNRGEEWESLSRSSERETDSKWTAEVLLSRLLIPKVLEWARSSPQAKCLTYTWMRV